jgi:uncharacterized protein (TIGR00375 family)
MQVIADFQLHSKYSRATSKNLSVEVLASGAKRKGLQLLGTGDFTHPFWLKELKSKLKDEGEGIFSHNKTFFILSGEISTIFENGQKKVHHVIHAPSFEIVEQISERLKKFGNLSADGRPTLQVSAAQAVEEIMEVDKNIFIYPSHAWTPWFGVFGSKSGFDSLKDCYQDQMKNIHALETGLSSDPAMNWRLSALDDLALLSSSDAHSANPWRLGREANVFELEKVTYKEIHDAILKKDSKKFLFTIETDPNYGKYHYDGHRNCNVSLSPKDSKKYNGFCPVCKRKLTIGVLNRVESLADREEGFIPKGAIPFKTLLPLYEIISFVLGVNVLYSKKVLEIHDKLIDRFGSEFNVVMNTNEEDLKKVVEPKIAEAIIKVREGKIKYEPGYDGVYGKPIFNGSPKQKFISQKSLSEF